MGNLAERRREYVKLLDRTLKEIVRALSSLEEIERISIFGSYARGRKDLFSDLDILIIMDTSKGFLDRLSMLYQLIPVPVDMDILCYTPQEWEKMKGRPFFKRLLAEEIILYEKRRLRGR